MAKTITVSKTQDLATFEAFEQALYEGLSHLNDPMYQPPALLWQGLGVPPQQDVKCLQSALIQAIEALKPAPNVAPHARSQRVYELLSLRYLQGLTQEETGDRLGLTVRHIRREQKLAVHGLAQWLWDQSQADDTPAKAQTPVAEMEDDEADTPTWRSQVQQELAALQQGTPAETADVKTVIEGVLKIGGALTAKHNICLNPGSIPPNLVANIHPSALRQIVLTAIEKLVTHLTLGEISLRARQKGGVITVTVRGGPVAKETPGPLPDSALIREILSTSTGEVTIRQSGATIVFQITLPSATEAISVLVVDDNADLLNFYRRWTTNTPYQITHLADGRDLFETIAVTKPDLIVLDVMLPDTDGWELLTYLHEHPDTRSIPVMICSVIRREELALSLGASLYVSKPVRRRQFIEALDQVCGRVVG